MPWQGVIDAVNLPKVKSTKGHACPCLDEGVGKYHGHVGDQDTECHDEETTSCLVCSCGSRAIRQERRASCPLDLHVSLESDDCVIRSAISGVEMLPLKSLTRVEA